MKITFEIPDWIGKQKLYLFAGMSPIAWVRHNDDTVTYKKVPCNTCGKCCMDLGRGHIYPTINGTCIHLKKSQQQNEKYRCGLGLLRPFSCCISDPIKRDYCCIEHEERDFEGNLL